MVRHNWEACPCHVENGTYLKDRSRFDAKPSKAAKSGPRSRLIQQWVEVIPELPAFQVCAEIPSLEDALDPNWRFRRYRPGHQPAICKRIDEVRAAPRPGGGGQRILICSNNHCHTSQYL
jgi:hypothetical protein